MFFYRSLKGSLAVLYVGSLTPFFACSMRVCGLCAGTPTVSAADVLVGVHQLGYPDVGTDRPHEAPANVGGDGDPQLRIPTWVGGPGAVAQRLDPSAFRQQRAREPHEQLYTSHSAVKLLSRAFTELAGFYYRFLCEDSFFRKLKECKME
jgi:hypothetical protein